jgi:hypothetical protein
MFCGMIEGQDYYAKSKKRADLILARLLGKPFPSWTKPKSRYYVGAGGKQESN